MNECFDCKKKDIGIGMTVGRIACSTVWTSICMDCFEKQPMTQREKTNALKYQIAMNELVTRLV